MLRRLTPAASIAVVLLACGVRSAAAGDAAPSPVGAHIRVTGPTQLWLTPAGQATLPDPTQPLCTFIWTVTFQQTGRDPQGWDTFFWSSWGNSVACQIRTQRFVVWDNLYDTWHHSLGTVRASCDAACTSPVSARFAPMNCNPCHVPGFSFTYDGQQLRNVAYEMDSFYTVTFEQPLLGTYEWATTGEEQYQGQGCGAGPGSPEIAEGDLYSHTCEQTLLWVADYTAADGPINAHCWGSASVSCSAVDPATPPEESKPTRGPRTPTPTTGSSLPSAASTTPLPMTGSTRGLAPAFLFPSIALPTLALIARLCNRRRRN